MGPAPKKFSAFAAPDRKSDYWAAKRRIRRIAPPSLALSLAAETLALIETIQADTTFETVTGSHCDRCSCRDICLAWAPSQP